MSLECTKCILSKHAGKNNASKGFGNPDAPMGIVLDCPGDALAEKLLIWLIYKLSLTGNDIWVDYTFKCPTDDYKKKELTTCYATCFNAYIRTWEKRKSLVLAGNWTSSFVGGVPLKDWHGRKNPDTECWHVYSFKYLLMDPAECLDTSRVLFKAAEEAGLSPKYNSTIPNFKFPPKKK